MEFYDHDVDGEITVTVERKDENKPALIRCWKPCDDEDSFVSNGFYDIDAFSTIWDDEDTEEDVNQYITKVTTMKGAVYYKLSEIATDPNRSHLKIVSTSEESTLAYPFTGPKDEDPEQKPSAFGATVFKYADDKVGVCIPLWEDEDPFIWTEMTESDHPYLCHFVYNGGTVTTNITTDVIITAYDSLNVTLDRCIEWSLGDLVWLLNLIPDDSSFGSLKTILDTFINTNPTDASYNIIKSGDDYDIQAHSQVDPNAEYFTILTYYNKTINLKKPSDVNRTDLTTHYSKNSNDAVDQFPYTDATTGMYFTTIPGFDDPEWSLWFGVSKQESDPTKINTTCKFNIPNQKHYYDGAWKQAASTFIVHDTLHTDPGAGTYHWLLTDSVTGVKVDNPHLWSTTYEGAQNHRMDVKFDSSVGSNSSTGWNALTVVQDSVTITDQCRITYYWDNIKKITFGSVEFTDANANAGADATTVVRGGITIRGGGTLTVKNDGVIFVR